jgi:hypothetical protein
MGNLWAKTQHPHLHQRWDLRFSEIKYLERLPGEAQRFLYTTRVGAGIRIEGAGESVGESDSPDGQRTSSLKFWSDDSKSLIKFGSGYWKYVPTSDGIRFITWYDYRTRFGIVGRIVDKILFRPLLGWMTAWSFDRLRLWVEKGVPPEISRDSMLTYTLCRLTVAFVWLYHGLIPKLVVRNADEIKMLTDVGIPDPYLFRVMSSLGLAEICFALALFIFWKSRLPLWFTLYAMIAATIGVTIASPSYLLAAFNPLTLNLAIAVLAVVGLLNGKSFPMASNCYRKAPDKEA